MSVEPGTVHLDEPGVQQLRVVAHYADGHRRDVTRQSLFKVNDDAAVVGQPAWDRRRSFAAPRPT